VLTTVALVDVLDELEVDELMVVKIEDELELELEDDVVDVDVVEILLELVLDVEVVLGVEVVVTTGVDVVLEVDVVDVGVPNGPFIHTACIG
jgi:hypothetical protein